MARRITRSEVSARGTEPSDLIGKMVEGLREDLGDPADKGVVIRAMGGEESNPFEAVPFGIPVLDNYLHGGIPIGRITEVFGPEGSGKTTLCYHAMAAHCKALADGQQGLCLYIDSEYRFDAPYAARIGVDMKRVILSQPEWGQQSFKAIGGFCERVSIMRAGFDPTAPIVKNKSVVGYEPLAGGPFTGHAAVLLDSVAALLPKSAYERIRTEGDYDGQVPAEQARMMSVHLQNIVGLVYRARAAAMFTNQTRVGGIGGYSGTYETTPGGNALKFYATARWKTGIRGPIKEGSSEDARVVGRMGSLQVVKCSLFSPFAPELRLPYTERGIDMSRILFDSLLTTGALKKDGSWYKFDAPERHPYAGMKFQGTNGFYEMLDAGTIAVPVLEALVRGEPAPAA